VRRTVLIVVILALAALAMAAVFLLGRRSAQGPAPPAAAAAPTPPPAAPAPVRPGPASLPAGFLGEWNATPVDCGTGRNETRLSISADRLEFHESSGPVTSVTAAGELEVSGTVELTGEGETRAQPFQFKLSPDGKALTDADGGLVRSRCPEVSG